MSIYYVYFYLRSKDSKTAKAGTPYYIGKGKKRRAFDIHYNIPVPKDKSKIILVEQNLTELQAFILERYYIRWFGRKDLGTGILLNKTDGGEGNSGILFSETTRSKMSNAQKGKLCPNRGRKGKNPWNKGKQLSKETKLKMSNSKMGKPSPNKGNIHTKETKLKMSESHLGKTLSKEVKLKISTAQKGKTCTEETKLKMSESHLGKSFSEETKLKMSISKKGISTQIIKCPHCSKIGGISAMKRWHFNNCRNIS